ncbi:hypothetical protein F511_44735 [Dorcoceras hygrometricum]|uniref:Uncharacterized protein n=1 Tax=Dorcoceras hygrometricum TaxID=472368 RepID=A0A2Z7AXM9_9LAMI|nr:hypothetical protein F511_44735 [Dorcoceras hygrometricum]
MAESSRRGGGKGKSIVPPARNFSPLNNQDLDFLFDDDDENTLQNVDVINNLKAHKAAHRYRRRLRYR